MLIGISGSCFGDEAPFVAGFERFFRRSESHDGGQLLISELSCTACHPTSLDTLEPKRGPNLDGAGVRLQSEWIGQFLKNPAAAKPGTTMPDMLGALSGDEKQRAVEALAAFLAAQDRPLPELKSTGTNPIAYEFWRKGDPERGRDLYHEVGCVACHEPDPDYDAGVQPPSAVDELLSQLDPDELEEMGLGDAARPVASIPHPDLPAKYTDKSLTHFLLDPHAVRPGGRMPSVKLIPGEAADIAAWLLREQPGDLPDAAADANPELVAAGRKLFEELRCSNCHAAKGVPNPKSFRPLAELDAGAKSSCINEPASGLPHFRLDDAQRRAIEATVEELKNGATAAPPAQRVTLQMMQLNCYACHVREGRGGVGPNRRGFFEIEGHVDLGDEGRIPPPLDGVGRKLTRGWMKKVFAGEGDVRPHMLARMPVFAPAVVESLPADFAKADEVQQQSEEDVFGETKPLADAGRLLLDIGCVQCHPIHGEQLPGVVGIDLAGITGRVHPQWFHDFLLNPATLKARTRMPTFFPGGKSTNQAVLDGNVDRQIAAMWEYIKRAETLPLPEKIEQGRVHNFELVPEEQPLLLRTFMQDAGMHAIAVGFPEKVHLAFDAERVRAAQVWRGRFIDAHGTWFDRFAPPAAPLGTDVVALPSGVTFAVLDAPDDEWPNELGKAAGYEFRGYRLDEAGTPTFLYRFASIDVEDEFTPEDGRTLRRRIKLIPSENAPTPKIVWFRANAGNKLQQNGIGSYSNDHGLTVTLEKGRLLDARVRTNDAGSDWIVPIDLSAENSIEMKYEW